MTTYSNLPYDVLHQICVTAKEYQLDQEECEKQEDMDQMPPSSLINLSMVDRRTREVAVPVIFQSGTISIKDDWFNTSEEEIHGIIDALMKSDEILRMIKHFVINIYFSDYQKFKVHHLPAKFGDLLFKFPNLNSFTLQVEPCDKAKEFLASLRATIDANREIGNRCTKDTETKNSKTTEPAVIAESRMLSSVRALRIKDDGLQFLTELCPNLEDLTVASRSYWGYDIRERKNFLDIQRLGELHPHLKKLHFSEPCDKDVLEELGKHLPRLEDVGFLSGYRRGSDPITNYIPYLKGLKNLKHLTLPYFAELGLGIRVPRCSRDWIDPQEAARQRQDAQRRLVESFEKFLETAPTTTMEIGFNSSDHVETPGMPTSSIVPMLQDVRVGSESYHNLFKVQRNGKLVEVNSK